MAREKVKIKGLRDIQKRLAVIEKETTRRTVARNSLKAGGKVIADEAERRAPEDEGTLRRSIGVSTRLSRRQRRRQKKRDPVEVYAGAASSSNAIQQEYGNINHAAQPFMRPAYDAKKRPALKTIIDYMRQAVEKSIARQAKKRAGK